MFRKRLSSLYSLIGDDGKRKARSYPNVMMLGLDYSSALRIALNYSLNQEQYLWAFLDDPEVPLDNNDAERSIKKFCVGKHSWHIIESKNGAKASAMMYSIAETTKANGLNPFEYFRYLMDQLKEYPRNAVPEDKLAELMP